MKKLIIILILQNLLLKISYSQSISELLGGVKTNFELFSDSIDLEAEDQLIILAAERYSGISISYQAGWGYGYQSFHFEFITTKRLAVKPTDKKDKNNYQLSFIDSDNVILQTIIVPSHLVDVRSNTYIQNSNVFYSIDLIDTPVLILDKTRKINIIRLN
jgi:hypothetical protein